MKKKARPIIPGDRFGRLVIVSERIKDRHYGRFVCRCDCGTEKNCREDHLKGGLTKSCGCLSRDMASEYHLVHGESMDGAKTTEWITWHGIKRRCCDPKIPAFQRYGGRGIKMCDRWVNSFLNFLQDVGRKPSPNHSIERIDNNGDYCPENCRWATMREQCNNRRSNRFLEYAGKRLTVAMWAEEVGINQYALVARLRYGWTVEKTLTTPIRGAA